MKRGQAIIILVVVLIAAIGTTLIIRNGISGMHQIVIAPPGPECCKTGYAEYSPSAHVPSGKCMEAYSSALNTIMQECPQVHTSQCTETKTQYSNTCQVQLCCPIVQN